MIIERYKTFLCFSKIRHAYLRILFVIKRNDGLLYQGTAFFFVNVIGAIFSFALQAFVARIMGTNQFGVYMFVLNWVLFLAIFSKIGIDGTALRFISSYNLKKSFGLLRGFLFWSIFFVFISSIFFGFALFIISFFRYHSSDTNIFNTFIFGSLALPLFAILQTNKSILLSLKSPISGLFPEQLARNIIFGFILLLLTCSFSIKINATHAMSAMFLATFFSLAYSFYWVHKRIPNTIFSSHAEYNIKEWLNVSLPLLVVRISETVNTRSDILILGMIRPIYEVGIYSAAMAISNCLVFFINAAGSVIAPRFSELHTQGLLQKTEKLLKISSQILLACTIPIGILIMVFGKEILLIFGPDFTFGYKALFILILGQIISVFFGPIGFLFSMTGHQQLFARVMIFSGIINIFSNFLLIYFWGITGAAISSSFTVFFKCIFLTYFSWKKLGVMPTAVSPLLIKLLRK